MQTRLVPCKISRFCNDTNYFEIAPFRPEGNTLVLDRKFYENICDTTFFLNLNMDWNDIRIEDNVIYGQTDFSPGFGKVYFRNYAWFSAENWAHIISEMKVVKYTKKEADHMKRMELDKLADLEKRLDKAIAEVADIENYGGVFCKLGMTSPKHDYNIQECLTGEEILRHLLPSPKIQRFIDACESIVLTKWNDEISPMSEYRVFIKDNQVRGVSQQFCYYDYVPYQLDTVYEEIIRNIQELWNTNKDLVEYTDVVLDIYLDSKLEPQIIELNPYGGWTGAGASLFHWKLDPPEKDWIEFRYVVQNILQN